MTKTGDDLNIGFIGSGNFSVLHNNAVKRSTGGKLAALWNRTESTRRKRASEFNCLTCNTAEELISNPQIDAVCVLTNLETHVKYAEMALNAGKHVFIEKPVAGTWEEVNHLKNLAEEKGLVCMPGHNMIYEDGIRRIRRLIQEDRLGKIISIYIMYNMFHSEEIASRYPGIIRQIFTHNLYSLVYLGGLPKKVSAFKECLHYENLDKEDICSAILQMKSGALAHISASFAADDVSADPWTFLIKVIGTKGTGRYTYQDWIESGSDAYHTKTYTAYQGTVDNEVQHFINLCMYGGAPLSSIEDAVHVQKTLEAIESSIRDEKTIYIEF